MLLELLYETLRTPPARASVDATVRICFASFLLQHTCLLINCPCADEAHEGRCNTAASVAAKTPCQSVLWSHRHVAPVHQYDSGACRSACGRPRRPLSPHRIYSLVRASRGTQHGSTATCTFALWMSPLKSSAISNAYSPLLLGRDSIRFRLILKSSNGFSSLQSAPARGAKFKRGETTHGHKLACAGAQPRTRAHGVWGGGAEGQNCGRPGSLRISASSAIRGWSTTVCRRIIVESALSRSRAKCEPSRAVDDSARAVPANAAPEDAAGEGDDHSSGAARRPPRSAASAAILARLCCRGWKFLPEIPRVWRTSKKRGHVLLALNPRYHLFPHSCCAVA